jgi:pimeloyl-ACP methyl ester carboxylesterase
MLIAGARDDVLKFPTSEPQIDHLPSTLPGLRGCHVLEGAGHWIQRERASAVNELLLGFLKTLWARRKQTRGCVMQPLEMTGAPGRI